MKFAFADPPYIGYSHYYDHPDRKKWDNPATHADLLHTLRNDYDGWAYCLYSNSLKEPQIIGAIQGDPQIRISAWVKPFASFKPGVNPGYTWEPLIFKCGRPYERGGTTIRDHLSCNIAMQKGLKGAKPMAVCFWVLKLLNFQPGDTLDDLFPGTGVMGRAVNHFCNHWSDGPDSSDQYTLKMQNRSE